MISWRPLKISPTSLSGSPHLQLYSYCSVATCDQKEFDEMVQCFVGADLNALCKLHGDDNVIIESVTGYLNSCVGTIVPFIDNREVLSE